MSSPIRSRYTRLRRRMAWGASALSVLVVASAAVPEGAAGQEEPTEYRVALSVKNDAFSSGFGPWRELSLQVSRSSEAVSVYGRLNQAHRFGRSGTQFEMDAYPGLGDGRYAFLNVGFADDAVFPTFRASAEVWQSLPGSTEASFGVRLMRFTEDVWLYTGSVGHYVGNYWLAARPWLRGKDAGVSGSVNVFIRRYATGRDDYFGLVLGAGSGISDQYTAAELDRLESYKAGIEGRRPVGGGWYLRFDASYEWEEFRVGENRSRYGVDLGIERRFSR